MNSFFPPNFHPESRCESLLTIDAKNETLIYDLTNNRALCLNQTASAIWSQCDGKKDVGELIKTIKEKHNIDSNEELIKLTLHELNQNNLLIKTDPLLKISETFNRREMLKKIGYTTAFVLPVITSLAAPKAVQAQSSAPLDGVCTDSCTSNAQCVCDVTNVICPPGLILNLQSQVGVCAGVQVNLPLPLIPINVGVGVCVYSNICVSL